MQLCCLGVGMSFHLGRGKISLLTTVASHCKSVPQLVVLDSCMLFRCIFTHLTVQSRERCCPKCPRSSARECAAGVSEQSQLEGAAGFLLGSVHRETCEMFHSLVIGSYCSFSE